MCLSLPDFFSFFFFLKGLLDIEFSDATEVSVCFFFFAFCPVYYIQWLLHVFHSLSLKELLKYSYVNKYWAYLDCIKYSIERLSLLLIFNGIKTKAKGSASRNKQKLEFYEHLFLDPWERVIWGFCQQI